MSEPIERLVLEGADPRGWGRQHGEAVRERIREIYAIRLELTLEKTDLTAKEEVLTLAARHLPLLKAFDAALYEELGGLAEGSGLSLEQLVVVNHYTDLRDLTRAHLDDDEGCSVVYSPTPSGPLLGQTWDMHGSATDYVLLLEVPSPAGPTLLFSLTGCLGMTGLTAWGLGMTINNLNSLDARVGILWPALVRKALREPDATAARDVVMSAALGSGHHYVTADEGAVWGVETSGTKKKLTQQGADGVHLHTNHCLDEEMCATARILATSTTLKRYEQLEAKTRAGGPRTVDELWGLLTEVSGGRSERSPHATATCGAFVMDLAARRALACKGPPSDLDYTVFDLSK